MPRGYPGVREPREVTLAKARARSLRLRLANPDAYRAKQRERYARDPDRIRAGNAGSYQRHRAKRLEAVKRYRETDIDRATIQAAKRLLNEQTGLRIRDVPDELARSKAAELIIKRELRAAEYIRRELEMG